MTATLTDAEAGRIEGLAKEALSDPWQLGTAGGCNVIAFGGDDIVGIAQVPNPNRRAYIASLDPATVLRLVIERRELRACLGELVACRNLRTVARSMNCKARGAPGKVRANILVKYVERSRLAWAAAERLIGEQK